MTDRTLETLNFDNLTLKNLFVDDEEDRYLDQRQVREANFSLVKPTPVRNPTLVAASAEALALLDLSSDQVAEQHDDHTTCIMQKAVFCMMFHYIITDSCRLP